MLAHLDFTKKWKYIAFLHENVISVDILFFMYNLYGTRCENPECSNVSAYRCPSCLNLGLPGGNFCSESCLQATWETHKLNHDKRGDGGFKYPGSLRPYAYSSATLRPVPADVKKPEWAETGVPHLLVNVTGANTIPYHGPLDIQKMKVASKVCRDALDAGHNAIKVGVTTEEIDRVVHEYIVSKGAYPSNLNYHKYPRSCTTSVNEVIC